MPAAAPTSMTKKARREIATTANFDPQALPQAALTAIAVCLDGRSL
jgi:hypothetical protein